MTDDARCPNCGGLYSLIGRTHLCRGRGTATPEQVAVIDEAYARVLAEQKKTEAPAPVAKLRRPKVKPLVKADKVSKVSPGCPVCAARRLANAARVRKHRQKAGTGR